MNKCSQGFNKDLSRYVKRNEEELQGNKSKPQKNNIMQGFWQYKKQESVQHAVVQIVEDLIPYSLIHITVYNKIVEE